MRRAEPAAGAAGTGGEPDAGDAAAAGEPGIGPAVELHDLARAYGERYVTQAPAAFFAADIARVRALLRIP